MQAPFGRIRSASWLILVLTALVMAGTLLLTNSVILQSDPVPVFVIFVFQASGGLVNGTLIASLCTLATTATVVFGIGRQRGWDVGWRVPELCWGLVFTISFWVAMQGVLTLLAAVYGDLSLHEAWKERGISVVIGGVLGQLLGNAFLEETLMRGFFLPQFYLKAAGVFRRGTSLTIAVLGSTLLFAMMHIPNRLWVANIQGGNLLLDQVGLVAFGLIAATVFLVTRNLFIAIGLHALVNAPAPIVQAPDITVSAVWFGLIIFILVTWALTRYLRAGSQHAGEDDPATRNLANETLNPTENRPAS